MIGVEEGYTNLFNMRVLIRVIAKKLFTFKTYGARIYSKKAFITSFSFAKYIFKAFYKTLLLFLPILFLMLQSESFLCDAFDSIFSSTNCR